MGLLIRLKSQVAMFLFGRCTNLFCARVFWMTFGYFLLPRLYQTGCSVSLTFNCASSQFVVSESIFISMASRSFKFHHSSRDKPQRYHSSNMPQQGTVDTTQMMSASRFLEMSVAQSFLKLAVGFLSVSSEEHMRDRQTGSCSSLYIWNFVGVQCLWGMENDMVNSQKRYCILINELLQGVPKRTKRSSKLPKR